VPKIGANTQKIGTGTKLRILIF